MKWIEKSIKGPIIIYRGGIHNGQIINRTSSLEFCEYIYFRQRQSLQKVRLHFLYSAVIGTQNWTITSPILQPLGHAVSLLCDYSISIVEFIFSPASNILGVTVYSIHTRSSSADICLSHVVRDLFFWWSYCNFRRYKRQLWKGTFVGAPVRKNYNLREND